MTHEIKTNWEQKPADRQFSATSERMWERIAKIEAIFRQSGAHQGVHGSVKYLVSHIARLDRLNERKTKQLLAANARIAELEGRHPMLRKSGQAAKEYVPLTERIEVKGGEIGKSDPTLG